VNAKTINLDKGTKINYEPTNPMEPISISLIKNKVL
jgi:hypothetical protein